MFFLNMQLQKDLVCFLLIMFETLLALEKSSKT